MIKDIKKQGKMIIVKFNLRQECEVKRCYLNRLQDDESLEESESFGSIDSEINDQAIDLLSNAFNMKADIVPHLDFDKKMIILELLPTNAAVSFDLSALIDDKNDNTDVELD